ncbi:MAG: hypothetical protein ABIP44_09265 [Pseudoxanthomonas sp.]
MINQSSKPLVAIVATALYSLLLLAVYFIHVRYLRVNVVFYGALLDVFIAAAIAALALVWSSRFRGFNGFEKAQLLVCWVLLGYIYAISVPTVIDRSLSFYLLEKLQQRGGGMRLDRFEAVFTKEYVPEHHLIAVRLTEQEQSGTLVVRDGCVLLTERGERLADFSRMFRKYLLPRHRLLMGKYTDVLVDPFAGHAAQANDACGLSAPGQATRKPD